jgi:hypothetical protein
VNTRVVGAIALVSLFAALIPPGSAATSSREWRFEVYLDDKPIGYHSFQLSSEAQTRRLRSEARFRVKVLGLTLYTYVHQSLELWKADCLQGVDASTDDNGTDFRVHGERRGEQLLLENQSGETRIPGCVMTFAYWNPAILAQQRLLNVQTGEYVPVSVEQLGQSTLKVDGRAVAATHYRIATDENDIELWYSTDHDWLGLRSTTRGGRQLDYRRVSTAAQAGSANGE